MPATLFDDFFDDEEYDEISLEYDIEQTIAEIMEREDRWNSQEYWREVKPAKRQKLGA